jgi:hypothetical protein
MYNIYEFIYHHVSCRLGTRDPTLGQVLVMFVMRSGACLVKIAIGRDFN